MMHNLTLKKNIRSFSVSPENPTGAVGMGGRATLEEGSAAYAARELGVGWKVNPYIMLGAQKTAILADVVGSGAIKHIWITDIAKHPRQLILRIYFDGAEYPAVHAPLSDFFANADYDEYRQISSLAICFNPRKAMNSFFEMPYRKGFRVEIENLGSEDVQIYYQIDCEEKALSDDSLYFHAHYRRQNPLPYMENYTVLDGVEGAGAYVGTYIHWGVKSNGWWGEGEFKFYIDSDTDYPTICGTGTEDYFLGSYNFDVNGSYTEYTTPYAGLSKVGYTNAIYRSQRYFDMYRWHICDPIYFKTKLRVTVQALGWRSEGRYLPLQDDISSVAYWYSETPEGFNTPFPSKNDLELT